MPEPLPNDSSSFYGRYQAARKAHCSRAAALGVALLGTCPYCAGTGLDTYGDVCCCPHGEKQGEYERLRNGVRRAAAQLPKGSSAVVHIARCPEHGLHGESTECFICGGEVEQVPMVPVEVAGGGRWFVKGATEITLHVCGVCGTYRCNAWRKVDGYGNALPGYHSDTPRKRRLFVAAALTEERETGTAASSASHVPEEDRRDGDLLEAVNGLLRVIDGRVSESDARTDIAFARRVAAAFSTQQATRSDWRCGRCGALESAGGCEHDFETNYDEVVAESREHPS